MPEILINVINKIPVLSGDVRQITADNGDYTVRLVFDDDWTDGEKTVLFVRENGFVYPAVVTKNNTAAVPRVSGVAMREWLYVGVKQGDVHTSRPCGIPVYRAITDMIDDDAVQPDESLWESVILRIEELEKNGGGGDANGKADKPVTITVELAEDNSFVIADHTAEQLYEMAQNGEVRLLGFRANEDESYVVLMADICGDSDTNDGVLYTAAANMQITSVPVLVLLNTSYENTNGTIVEAPAAGTSSSGGALNLQYWAGTLTDITLSKEYTYADVRAALLANRPITLTTYTDGSGETWGMYHVIPGASVGANGGIRFIGFSWTEKRGDVDEPLPDLGWTPRSAVLAEDGTLTFEDEWFEGYAKQTEVDQLSEAIADLEDKIPSEVGGMTAEQRNSLVAIVNAIGAFNVTNGQELIDSFNAAWQIRVAATNITLDKSALEFISTASQMLTATVEPEDSTDTVVWSTSAPTVATVNNGVVTPVSDGSAVITATAGSVSASCSVSVEFAEEVVYYTITNNLTNCATDNSAVSVVEGGSYSATLTADEGYTLDGASVSVVVNGEDVTDTAYSDGVITIANVTGNVVITVSAVEKGTGDSSDVVMLKSIITDGVGYVNTDVFVENSNNRYVLGIQYPAVVNEAYIAGVAMRTSSLATSPYWDFWVNTVNNGVFGIKWTWEGLISKALNSCYNASDAPLMNEQPFYLLIENKHQALYLDEELTILTNSVNYPNYDGDEPTVFDVTTTGTYKDENHPILPIWLGKLNASDNAAYKNYATKTMSGLKIYCFKVYDSDKKLIVDMRPAKQGNAVGMWDNIRNKFYPATGAYTYEEVA